MQGIHRPSGVIIQRELQYLQRVFPQKTIEIYRETNIPVTTRGQRIQGTGTRQRVYAGECLYIPAGGVVTLLGGGQVERTSPSLIVIGDHPVQQGDYVAIEGRTYQVEFAANRFGFFVDIQLQQYKQAV